MSTMLINANKTMRSAMLVMNDKEITYAVGCMDKMRSAFPWYLKKNTPYKRHALPRCYEAVF